jgi:hypothetical protein
MLHIRGRSVGLLKDNVLDGGRNSGIVGSCASRSRKCDANLYALVSVKDVFLRPHFTESLLHAQSLDLESH